MSTTGVWRAAIALMGLCVIATGWLPLLTLTALPSAGYNEGWNAYRQWMALSGQPLYGAPPGLWTTNYPFLSFHIIGLLGGAKVHMVLAGRIVCFASLLVACGLAGAIVQGVAGSRAGAVYAGLCLFAWLGAFNGAGRAVDDPEMLSVAFASFGLCAYFRAPRRVLAVALAAVAFSVSLFIKHDLLGFALSVGIHLLSTRQWRLFAVLLAAGVASSGLLLALSFHLDGAYFFQAFLRPRAYSLQNLRAETLHYLLHFTVALLVGLVLLWRNPAMPGRGFLFILLLVTNSLSIGFCGGDGVAANIFYPPLIADVLACVIAICWVERTARTFKTALVVTSLAGALMVPFQIHNDIAAWQRLPAATQEAWQAMIVLKSTPGPAICEDLLLCYEAGKPMDYDPYYVRDQILIGRIQEASVQAMLNSHHYAAIQLNGAAITTRTAAHFTTPFLRTFLLQYRPVLVTRSYAIYLPRS